LIGKLHKDSLQWEIFMEKNYFCNA